MALWSFRKAMELTKVICSVEARPYQQQVHSPVVLVFIGAKEWPWLARARHVLQSQFASATLLWCKVYGSSTSLQCNFACSHQRFCRFYTFGVWFCSFFL